MLVNDFIKYVISDFANCYILITVIILLSIDTVLVLIEFSEEN